MKAVELDMSSLKNYLEQMVQMQMQLRTKANGYEFNGMEDLVLKKGIHFTKEKKFTKEGRAKECFMNAFNKMLNDDNMIYCEGFALSIIPTMHAWCCDKKGNVFDPTWTDGVDYIGIPFKKQFVIKTVVEREYYGIIDNWQNKWPLIKQFPEDIKERIEQ